MFNFNEAVLGASSQNLFITFLASFLVWFMFAGLILLWIGDGRMNKEQALHAFAAAVLVWVISLMLKSLLPTTRPFLINGDFPLTLTMPGNGAFPSTHTAVAFSLATTIWLRNRKLGCFYLCLAFLVGVGRILANVHYVLDILMGGFLGTMTAVIVGRLQLFKMLKIK